MYTRKELNEEIDGQLQAGMTSARWVTTQIVKGHEVDEPHATFCQWEATRAAVGRRMAAFSSSAVADQLTFLGRGFECLQPSYVLVRDDDEILVPVLDMTPAEHRQKAAELALEADAKQRHALEHIDMARLKETQKTA